MFCARILNSWIFSTIMNPTVKWQRHGEKYLRIYQPRTFLLFNRSEPTRKCAVLGPSTFEGSSTLGTVHFHMNCPLLKNRSLSDRPISPNSFWTVYIHLVTRSSSPFLFNRSEPTRKSAKYSRVFDTIIRTKIGPVIKRPSWYSQKIILNCSAVNYK